MYQIRKATIDDCALINVLAKEVFPVTYKEILSKEQMNYMMDWMYSLKNIRKQMEEEGHVYFISYHENKPCGYVSVQLQGKNEAGKDIFHLQKIYALPQYQGKHCGSFLFHEAIKYIKSVHPSPCLLELNVNRHNKALLFYEHMGMKKSRQGDFDIGNGYFMNDYIMEMELPL
ncbi:MAG: GNAT family N-acetyltransferase [Bacteroidaceae bacterium]